MKRYTFTHIYTIIFSLLIMEINVNVEERGYEHTAALGFIPVAIEINRFVAIANETLSFVVAST